MSTITGFSTHGFLTHDVRCPRSRQLDGSDAMPPFPDYSAAHLTRLAPGGGARMRSASIALTSRAGPSEQP